MKMSFGHSCSSPRRKPGSRRWIPACAGMTGGLLVLSLVVTDRLRALDGEQIAPPLVKSVVRLNRAPISKEVLRINMPRPVEAKLDNGLTVLVLERHRLPTVHIALWIESGALSDPKSMPGLAQFTAEMLREGTSHRTSAQISSEVDALGVSLSASSGFGSDISEVSASGLAADLESLMDLSSDAALNPTFPNSELAKYKTRRLSNLEEERTDSAFLAREKLLQELYPGSPAAVIAPTKDSIRGVTSEDLKEFHDSHYLPNNATLGIAGDVKPEEAIALAKKYFGGWKSRSLAPMSPMIVPALRPFKICLVNRPGSIQTDIVAGNISVAYKDPDHIPLIIANHVLGEGSESRLNMNLRENKGYTYDAISDVEMNRYPGPWFVSTEVRNAVTGDALRELLAEFRRLRNEKVPGLELGDSKRAVVARFALSLESPSLLLERWMLTKYYGAPDDYWDRYPEVAARVDATVVQRIAKRYLDPIHMQIVCVGDAKQILEALKKYGPVEVYDADGKRL